MNYKNCEIVLNAERTRNKTARDVQQEFADLYSDIRDCFGLLDLEIMQRRDFEIYFKYYIKGMLEIGVIIVVVANSTDQKDAKSSTQFSCHLVFRMHQCYAANDANSYSNPMFFDEAGRVYQDWTDYKENNILPKGIMVVPRDGIYLFQESKVILDTYPTPAATLTSAALGIFETVASFCGLFSGATAIAAFCGIPITPPISAAAAAMGLVATCFSVNHSVAHLIDRYQHEQSINLCFVEPRNSWLSIANTVVGLSSVHATSKLALAAATGKNIGMITKRIVNRLNVSAITLSGCVLAHSAHHFHLNRGNMTKLDYLQLAESFALYTQSAYNFCLASNIILEMQNKSVHDLQICHLTMPTF